MKFNPLINTSSLLYFFNFQGNLVKIEEDDGFVDTLDSGRGESIRERHSSDNSQVIGQGQYSLQGVM